MLEVNAFSWQTSNDCVLSISFYKNNHKNLSEHKRSIIYSILTVLYGKPNLKKYENISNQIDFKKAVVVFDKNIYEWKLKDRFLYLQELNNGVYQLRISRGEFYQEPDTPLIKPDDDTLYNDRITIEFSLQDQDGRNFCLYHNIRSIKDWTSNDNKRYTELLRKQEKNDLETAIQAVFYHFPLNSLTIAVTALHSSRESNATFMEPFFLHTIERLVLS